MHRRKITDPFGRPAVKRVFCRPIVFFLSSFFYLAPCRWCQSWHGVRLFPLTPRKRFLWIRDTTRTVLETEIPRIAWNYENMLTFWERKRRGKAFGCFSAGHVVKVHWKLNHEFCSCSFTRSLRLLYVRKVCRL